MTTETRSTVTITHPDRLVFSELGLTKIDVANYYASVAP